MKKILYIVIAAFTLSSVGILMFVNDADPNISRLVIVISMILNVTWVIMLIIKLRKPANHFK
ncbi:hypothetical protein D3C87_894140 [compost metagenome]